MIGGAVKYFNADRGWGFLSRDDGQDDVFFHIKELHRAGITDSPKVGDRFTFELAVNDLKKKWHAVDLKKAGDAPKPDSFFKDIQRVGDAP